MTAGADIPAEVLARAARVRLACFDVDGVMTSGALTYAADGSEIKSFHALDGLGLKLLRDNGIEVALITARESKVVEARARELALRHVYQGQADKLACLTHLCRALGIALEQVAYTGDDLPDLGCLQRVGLAVAVANAHEWIVEQAHWRTRRQGGGGAVREVCDLILVAQGKREAILARHRG